MPIPKLFASTGVLPEGSPADGPHGALPEVAPEPSNDLGESSAFDNDFATPPDYVAPSKPAAPQAAAQQPVVDTDGVADSPAAREEAAAAKPAESQPAEPAEDGDGFDDDLLSYAEFHGFTADEARDFGSPELLQKMLIKLDKQAADWGRKQLAAQEPQQDRQPAAQSNANAQNGQQQSNQQPSTFEKFKLTLDANSFDEEAIKALNGINDHYDSAFRKQQEQLQALAQFVIDQHQGQQQITGQQTAEANARMEQELDTFFGGLGDEFSDIFGKEPLQKLTANDPKVTARNRLLEEMNVLRFAYQNTAGKKVPTDSDLRRRALAALYPEKLTTAARKEVADKVAQRRTQAVARPGGHRAKPMTGEEKAMQRERDFAQKHRLYEGTGVPQMI
jgi:hypothetical protein